MKKNQTLLISTIIACCIATVLVTTTIFVWLARSDSDNVTKTTSSPTPYTEQETPQTVTETEKTSKEINQNQKQTTPQPKTQAKTEAPEPKSQNNKILENGGRYIIKNTPNGDGLVMRSAPSSSSEKLEVIPEGTPVIVSSDNSSNNTGYVYVVAMLPMYDRHGYILKEYLEFEKSTIYETDPNTRYVSYSTPEHKGLVLRSEPTYYSAQVSSITIREGEEVTILSPYDPSNNGYVYVNYNQLPTGDDGYYGWVLYKYLVS